MFKKFVGGYNFYIALADGRRFEANSDQDSSAIMIATANNNGYQEWTAYDCPGRDGVFYLKTNRHDRLLDCDNGSVYTRHSGKFPPSSENIHQLWTIELVDDNNVRLKNIYSGQYLTYDTKGNSFSVKPQISNSQYVQLWTVDICNVNFSTSGGELQLASLANPKLNDDMAYEETMYNDGPVAQTTPFTRSVTRTHTFTWSLEESVGISETMAVEVGLPGIGKESSSVSVSFNLKSTQSFTTTETFQYTFAANLNFGPFSRVHAQCILSEGTDLTIPGKLRFVVGGTHGGGQLEQAALLKLVDAMVGGTKSVTSKGVVIELPCQVKTGYAMGTRVDIQSIASDIVLTPAKGKSGDVITLSGSGVQAATKVCFYVDEPNGPSQDADFVSSDNLNSVTVVVPDLKRTGAAFVKVSNGPVDSDPEKFTYA